MTRKPRLLMLNPTCLDVLDEFRSVIEAQGVELVADPEFRRLPADAFDSILQGAQALVLPAMLPLLPLHMQRTPTLQVISIAASGFESVELEAATSCGIVVTNAPMPAGAEVVADLTWGLILSIARQIPHHHQMVVAGQYERGMGTSVWGKTLGVVGLGNIGRAVARRAKGFEMRVLTTQIRNEVNHTSVNLKQPAGGGLETRTHPNDNFIREHGIELVSKDELLQRSDFVSLHVRLNSRTQNLIGSRELGLMKPSAYLINTARKELVEEAALTEAILNHQIAGAAMDDPPKVKGSPLLALPNFVCTPHLGNRAIEGVRAVCRCALENAVAVVQGRRPAFVLNPEVYAGHLRAPHPGKRTM